MKNIKMMLSVIFFINLSMDSFSRKSLVQWFRVTTATFSTHFKGIYCIGYNVF